MPLFVSHGRLRRYKTLRPASVPSWVLDSGSFSEVDRCGADAFADGPGPYVEAAYRYRAEIGHLDWCAPQDWMCEPWMVERTGLSVRAHQERTVTNLLALRSMAPDLPFAPVLQGWTAADYLTCIDLYSSAGVDLTTEPTVGVGSVCRRQHTAEIAEVFQFLAGQGLHLHGFGVKTGGIAAILDHATSVDSMAWSYRARMDGLHRRLAGLPSSRFGCEHRGSCSHCPQFALWWRDRVLAAAAAPFQQHLPWSVAGR